MPLAAYETRRHGWQRPFNLLQIVGMAVFCFLVAAFYCFPGLLIGQRIAEIALNSVFSFVAVAAALLFIRCAAIDPGDKTRLRFKKKRPCKKSALSKLNNGYILGRILLRFLRKIELKILRTCIRRKYLDPLTTKIHMEPLLPFPLVLQDDSVTPNPKDNEISFCNLCDFEVNKYSKHCRTCNRCVEGFDHHCRWLNNCVGKKNYATFFLLMIFLLIMLVLESGTALAVFIRCFADSKGIEEELNRRHYRNFPRAALATFCILLVALTSYTVAALGQLFFFHVVLIRKGISTYDFILAMREENRSLNFEMSDDSSDFSSEDEDEVLEPEKCETPAAISWMMCNGRMKQHSHIVQKMLSKSTSKETKGFHEFFDPWKLTNLKREEVLQAREKASSHDSKTGRDPLKPLPLETKSGLLINSNKDASSTSCSQDGRRPFGSPRQFSSPRKRFHCSLQQQAASPKLKHKSDFDLKLTAVSRELETHISKQLLRDVLKNHDNENSPR